MATKEEIHRLADKKDIPWDDNPKFKRWSKGLTGTACLDKMSPKQLAKVKKALAARASKEKKASLSIGVKRLLTGAAGGGSLGALAGASTGTKEERVKRGLVGALAGATAGAGLGRVYSKANPVVSELRGYSQALDNASGDSMTMGSLGRVALGTTTRQRLFSDMSRASTGKVVHKTDKVTVYRRGDSILGMVTPTTLDASGRTAPVPVWRRVDTKSTPAEFAREAFDHAKKHHSKTYGGVRDFGKFSSALARGARANKDKTAGLAEVVKALKGMPKDEAIVTALGVVAPAPGTSVVFPAMYKGVKSTIQHGPPGSSQRGMVRAIEKLKAQKKSDKEWKELLGWKLGSVTKMAAIEDSWSAALSQAFAKGEDKKAPKVDLKDITVEPKYRGRSWSGGEVRWNLKHKGEVIGGITTKGNQVSLSGLDNAYRGQGLGRHMYKEVLRNMPEGKMYSDTTLSDQGRRAWRSLHNRGDARVLRQRQWLGVSRSPTTFGGSPQHFNTAARAHYRARIPKDQMAKLVSGSPEALIRSKIAPTLGENVKRIGTKTLVGALAAAYVGGAGYGMYKELKPRKKRKTKQASGMWAVLTEGAA